MINGDGRLFRANICERANPINGSREYLYNPFKRSFQYRVRIPGIKVSMIVIDVTEAALRYYQKTSTPILITPYA